MRRGTKVGQAYVALTVDGTGVNRQIADDINDVDYEKIGRDAGGKFEEGWSNRTRSIAKDYAKSQSDAMEDAVRNIGQALEHDRHIAGAIQNQIKRGYNDRSLTPLLEAAGKKAGYTFGEGFDEEFETAFLQAYDKMQKEADRRGSVIELTVDVDDKGFHRTTKQFDQLVAKAQAAVDKRKAEIDTIVRNTLEGDRQVHDARMKQVWEHFDAQREAAERFEYDEVTRLIRKENREETSRKQQEAMYARLFDQIERMEERAAEKFDKAWESAHAENLKRNRKAAERYEKDWDAAIAEKFRREERAETAIWKVRNASAKAHAKYLAELERGSIDERGNSIRGGGRNKDILSGAAIGALFGAGSRNNFLNLLGRSIGNTIGLVGKLTSGITSMLTTFTNGMAKAGASASQFSRVMSGMSAVGSSALGGLAAALPALAIAIPVIIIMVSALTSVIGALLGIVTALAGALVAGLTAALAVAGGAIMAVVAAGGLLTAAFMSMDDAQKKVLKESFTPLREMMVGLGQIMMQEMVPAFATWSENLQRAVVLAVPAAQQMGRAFAEAGNIITGALSGPGFQKFAQAMATFLPNITVNLSKAFGNFLNGVTALFSALMPYVERFSLYLSQVTERFSNWANSTEGQNSIVDWADRAVASLLSLWNFVREFTGFIVDVLFNPQTQEVGRGFFDSLADSFHRFRQAVADGSLEGWLNDAKNFASDLKNMLIGVKDAFVAIYDSGVLQAVGSAISALGGFIEAISPTIEWLTKAIGVWMLGSFVVWDTVIWVVVESLSQLWDGISSLFPSMESLGGFIEGVSERFGWMAEVASAVSQALSRVWNWISALATQVMDIPALGPLGDLLDVVVRIGNAASDALGFLQKLTGTGFKWGVGGGEINTAPLGLGPGLSTNLRMATPTPKLPDFRSSGWPSALQSTGRNALANTTQNKGGSPNQTFNNINMAAPKYVNPYEDWANSLIKNSPGIMKQIRQAVKKVSKEAQNVIRNAFKEADVSEVRGALKDLRVDLRETGAGLVDTAQSALDTAARALASAGSPEAAARALAQVKQAQKNLAAANKEQKRLNQVAKLVNAQREVDDKRVGRLLKGLKARNATLADYAKAQEITANRLEKAKAKLEAAITLRDDFYKSVADSVRSFGSLLTAQAQTINGVQQDLTAGDITGNLQDRLAKIKAFHNNLRILLAQGLSAAAYKQIVDAGVETGSAYADALVQGGAGAVDQTNSLVAQIDKAAESLGLAASSQLYQAGVDAAQGLVDGLLSLSGELEFAAGQLGTKIANSIAARLGIKSPSRVLMAMMDDAGDGLAVGLNNQSTKVSNAAAGLADKIAVSPEVAAYAAMQGRAATVSGNGTDSPFNDLHIHTPTEDPKAVAMETVNEMVGRFS